MKAEKIFKLIPIDRGKPEEKFMEIIGHNSIELTKEEIERWKKGLFLLRTETSKNLDEPNTFNRLVASEELKKIANDLKKLERLE